MVGYQFDDPVQVQQSLGFKVVGPAPFGKFPMGLNRWRRRQRLQPPLILVQKRRRATNFANLTPLEPNQAPGRQHDFDVRIVRCRLAPKVAVERPPVNQHEFDATSASRIEASTADQEGQQE